ncbi:MAG TPA: S8 family serine peptidase [Mycobacteriales bacterium]|nr:S8 family serine peptidase [Mycobacteriales bacterium]
MTRDALPTRSGGGRGTLGLSGPVADVLARAPARGPVRVVALKVGRRGEPVIRVTHAADRAAAAATVANDRRSPDVVAVAVDTLVRAADVFAPIPVPRSAVAGGTGMRAAAVGTDTLRSVQWALDRLHAEQTWALRTAAGRTVAVVDTGVANPPDLAVRLLPGIDLLDGSEGRFDPNGHGTHVAGIVAAVAGNALGVAGLSGGAQVLPVRVLDADGYGWGSDIADGIVWAVNHGASVVNLSLGGSYPDPFIESAGRYATDAGVVVVAAAGNERADGNPVTYPAAFPGVVAVAASDPDDRSAPWSETGSYVSVTAPGVGIVSTYNDGGYANGSGTSMAAPYAAAEAALVQAANPGLDRAGVVATMMSTAVDLGPTGHDDEFGTGLIDPLAAVRAALPSPPAPAPPPPPPPAPVATRTTLSSSARAPVRAGSTVVLTIGVRTATGARVTGTARLCTRRLPARATSCRGVAVRGGVGRIALRPQLGTVAYAAYAGATGLRGSVSSPVTIRVLPVVRTKGGVRVLHLSVGPAQRQRVAVQRVVSRRWRTVAAVTVTRHTDIVLRRLRAGSYRLVVPATAELSGVTTGVIRIR